MKIIAKWMDPETVILREVTQRKNINITSFLLFMDVRFESSDIFFHLEYPLKSEI